MTTIEIIFHISDIHIRDDKYVQYKAALDATYESIKENLDLYRKTNPGAEALIAITGDVFHYKTHYGNNDIEEFYEFLLKIKMICRVVMIAGNHDTAKNPKDKENLLSPFERFCLKTPGYPITFFKNSGCFKLNDIDDIEFSVISVLDTKSISEINKIKETRPPVRVRIGLFHRMLDNMSGDTKDLIEFTKNCDAVLAGDVHECMKFGENGAYAGSLFQQNIGESMNKGMLRWIIAKNGERKLDFIHIKTNYGKKIAKRKYKIIKRFLKDYYDE